jgi:hypothetical protein
VQQVDLVDDYQLDLFGQRPRVAGLARDDVPLFGRGDDDLRDGELRSGEVGVSLSVSSVVVGLGVGRRVGEIKEEELAFSFFPARALSLSLSLEKKT